MTETFLPSVTDALIVVDMQNDFCPGGALAVPEGDLCVEPINHLIARFDHVILTQDWHPPGHSSFASSHTNGMPYGTVEAPYGVQTLWPDHCVQGTYGAAFHLDLNWTKAELVLRKGFRPAIDSYSAFQENDRETQTGLAAYLRERGFQRLFMVGLALDYCVCWSALDGREEGFEVIVLEDACRAINLSGSLAEAKAGMTRAGVVLATCDSDLS